MASFESALANIRDPESWRNLTIASLNDQLEHEKRAHHRDKLQATRERIANATLEQIAAHLQRRMDEENTRRVDRWTERMKESPRYVDCTIDNFRISNPKQQIVINKLRDFASTLEEKIESGKNLVLAGNCGTGKDHCLFALMRHAFITLGLTTQIRLWTGTRLIANAKANLPQPASRATREVIALSDPVLPGESVRFSTLSTLYQIVDEAYRRRWPIWCTLNASCREEMIAMLSAPVVDRLIDGAVILHFDWPSYRKPESVERVQA